VVPIANLPFYPAEEIAALSTSDLIALMVRDHDRVPRNVIDEAARRGDDMVESLRKVIDSESHWRDDADYGEWWLSLHAAMILGLIPGEAAGMLLVQLMRCLSKDESTAEDDGEDAEAAHVQDWLVGYWPALFANKPQSVIEAVKALSEDPSMNWYIRVQASEIVVASAQQQGPAALEPALDWSAARAADESEDWTLRLCIADVLLDFPRPRHRALLKRLAGEQSEPEVHFSAEDVVSAFTAGTDEPYWTPYGNPWEFYDPAPMQNRQARWETGEIEEGEFLHEEDELVEPYVREAPKLGRNDACLCGSGKKYKHCCLNKEAQA
jgi:hypothetical protein